MLVRLILLEAYNRLLRHRKLHLVHGYKRLDRRIRVFICLLQYLLHAGTIDRHILI